MFRQMLWLICITYTALVAFTGLVFVRLATADHPELWRLWYESGWLVAKAVAIPVAGLLLLRSPDLWRRWNASRTCRYSKSEPVATRK